MENSGYDVHTNFDISERNLVTSGIRGVAIYVNENLNSNEVKFSTDFDYHIWVQISLPNHESLLCGCIYRSPSKEKEAAIRSTKQVCKLVSMATERNDTFLLICGDFNYRDINWENNTCDESNEYLSDFINTIHDCFLHQHVTEPTRYRYGEQPSLLDLILSNEEGTIHNLDYQPGLGDSDHVSLNFNLICYKDMNDGPRPQPNFFKADYEAIRYILSNVNWEEALAGNFEESYEIFMEHLNNSIKNNVPNRAQRKSKKNIYMNGEAIRMKNKKHKLWKRYYSVSRNAKDYNNFIKCKNHLRSLTRRLRNNFEQKLALN